MKINKIIGLIVLCAITLSSYAQESATRGTANNVKQPDVIVVPYVKQGQDERTILENNPLVSLAVSKIKEEFGNRGFITKDFVTLLKAGSVNDLTASKTKAKTDAVKLAIMESKADIYVTVKAFVNKHANGASDVGIELQAADVVSGESFANASYTSDKFITQDSLKLTARALEKINDDFFFQLQNGFNDMMANGRTVDLVIELADGCEIDPYSEVGTNGKILMDELHDWLSDNAFGGNYELEASDMIFKGNMKMPLYDQKTGKPYATSRITGPFVQYLRKLVAPFQYTVDPAKTTNQQIWFVIKEGKSINN